MEEKQIVAKKQAVEENGFWNSVHGARILCLGCSSMFGTETDHWTAKKPVEERLEE